MFRRRVKRETKTYHRESFSVIPLCLIALLMLLSTIVFSQTNVNQKYDLNDPRNPDCPCHKLQKQAEDEYKQIQMENNTGNEFVLNTDKVILGNGGNTINSNDRVVEQSNKGVDDFGSGIQKISRDRSSSSGTQKKKKLFWFIQKKRNIYRIKHSGIKNFRIKTSDCFHWD
jgi:hypothetical protein